MRVRTPSAHALITTLLLAFATGLYLFDPEPIARFRMMVFDAYQRLSPRNFDPELPVRIVDIDEASLAKFGQWPWARTELATMIDNLREAGAKAIALDMVLPEPDRLSPSALARLFEGDERLAELSRRARQLPSNDERLAEAIEAAPMIMGFIGIDGAEGIVDPPRASLAFAGHDPKEFVPGFSGGYASLPVLTRAAKGLGAVNWLPEHDQIIRHLPLLLRIGDQIYPSLPLESLRLASGETTVQVRSSGSSEVYSFGQKSGVESVRVGKTVLPTDADGQIWIRFSHSDPRRSISAHRVIEGTFDKSEVTGKHIVIGSSAPGLLDLRATPLELAVPGVEVHAQALEQMISGDHLLRPDYATGAELVFLVVTGALVGWLIRRSGPVIAAIIGLSSIFAVLGFSWVAFAYGGSLFDPVYPSLALMLIYSVTTLHNYVVSDLERARVRSAFAHYMAPSLVDELAEHPERLQLGGETRELTVLFSDVRGFSRLSEGMAADTLVRFVNRLFTPLTEVILDERGTIDKYIGDAVMAFWNAPLDDPDHARNACRAALRMVEELERLNVAGDAERERTGKPHEKVRIGIGLNSGPCCVGNLGSPQRFDYSIIGEAVNVASRLEGVTKTYGLPIVAGASTAAAAPDFAFIHIDTIVPRGKERRERVYALMGDEETARTHGFKALKEAIDAYHAGREAGDMDAAVKALTALKGAAGGKLDLLVAAYEARLKEAA